MPILEARTWVHRPSAAEILVPNRQQAPTASPRSPRARQWSSPPLSSVISRS